MGTRCRVIGGEGGGGVLSGYIRGGGGFSIFFSRRGFVEVFEEGVCRLVESYYHSTSCKAGTAVGESVYSNLYRFQARGARGRE